MRRGEKAMKRILLVLVLSIAAMNAHAGIASIITYLQGECEKPDEQNVSFCSDRKTGEIYYIYQGERYSAYPKPTGN